MNKNQNLARITYRISGKNYFHYIRYHEKIDLIERIFNFEAAQSYHVCVFLVTDIANGLRLLWDSTMAHYCFAKGRITPDQFADHLESISQKTEIKTLT